MASYKFHMVGGVAASGLCLAALSHSGVYSLTLEHGVLALVVGVLAGLFPDVDTNSRGQDIFYAAFFILDVVLLAMKQYKYAALLGLLTLLPIVGRHRGWTHTWWAMLLVPLPILILPAIFFGRDPREFLPIYAVAVAGYFSHLVLDWKFR